MVAESTARQASLRRLEAFGIRPKRNLGQNFLIDDNLLDVVARAAELEPNDVVLEVGGGLGVLSEYLADRVRFVHVFEVDPALKPALEDAIGDRTNARLNLSDAARADLAELKPKPRKLVANLPYSVAVPVILRVVVELPDVDILCAMVQREIAERLVAEPGSKDYGIPSVMAQLACAVKVVRKVSPTVFVPRPNVESALIVLRRRRPFPDGRLRPLVAGSFAHRRKALARSLALASEVDPALLQAIGLLPAQVQEAVASTARKRRPANPPSAQVRKAALEALDAMGKSQDIRAERLSPADFEELFNRLTKSRADGNAGQAEAREA